MSGSPCHRCLTNGMDTGKCDKVLAAIWTGPRAERRLIPTRANGQPAFALYFPDPHGHVMHATGLLVLTLAGDRISVMTRFDNSVLTYFDLPRTLPTDTK